MADRISAEIVTAAKISTRESRILAFFKVLAIFRGNFGRRLFSPREAAKIEASRITRGVVRRPPR